jgi:hypothetical protein
VSAPADVIWKAIPSCPGYEASDAGGVRNARTGAVLRPYTTRAGHKQVVPGTAAGSRLVHRLVLEAFVGPCPPGLECRHLNGDPADNRIGNLAWGTRGDNTRDDKWNGRPRRGRLSVERVRAIKAAIAAGANLTALAAEHGVCTGTIYCIRSGRNHADV